MRSAILRHLFLSLFLICGGAVFSQHTTINGSKKESDRGKHKVMLIPFEPRMYMSEIDYHINKDTKMSGKEIKAIFRDGINDQLYKAFKPNFPVVDLLEDTVKTKKDLDHVYQHLAYEYMKVPDQEHYTPPKKEKEEKKIQNGQIVVETNTDLRFMNAKIKNASLVPYLYGKYKSDVFVFINQLDIKASGAGGPAEMAATQGNRKLIVHYTVYTHDAKEINSGIADIDFPASLNVPSKIINTYFSKLAQQIVQRVNLALTSNEKK